MCSLLVENVFSMRNDLYGGNLITTWEDISYNLGLHVSGHRELFHIIYSSSSMVISHERSLRTMNAQRFLRSQRMTTTSMSTATHIYEMKNMYMWTIHALILFPRHITQSNDGEHATHHCERKHC